MAAKALFVFCASSLFLQTISGQYCGNGINSGYLNNGCGNGLGSGSGFGLGLGSGLGLGCGLGLGSSGYGNSGLGYGNGLGNIGNFAAAGPNSAASGGPLGVSSGSPIYPDGLAVLSENTIGGCLDVAGRLPFASAVALQGEVASAGSAGVQYSCGSGNIGITSVGSSGSSYGSGIGSGLGYGAGVGSGINGIGFGNRFGGILNSCDC